MYEDIKEQTYNAVKELIEISGIKDGELLVIGCSTSEIVGGTIGKASAPEAAEAVTAGVLEAIGDRKIYLAAQCCEHLNRALIIERESAEKFGYECVNVRPRPKAGGSFATKVFEMMEEPVAVEHIKAAAGLDIGSTLIGMHLKDVAVPVRLNVTHIGKAYVTAARTRAKFIGGVRAEYI